MQALDGFKTYLVGILMIVSGALLIVGELVAPESIPGTVNEHYMLITLGLAVLAGRQAVAKVEKKLVVLALVGLSMLFLSSSAYAGPVFPNRPHLLPRGNHPIAQAVQNRPKLIRRAIQARPKFIRKVVQARAGRRLVSAPFKALRALSITVGQGRAFGCN